MTGSRHAIILILLASGSLFAQDKTSGHKTPAREPVRAHKVMLIPYEPRMYMGEVDRQIHEETRLSPTEIRAKFRDGLNEQLYRAFKGSEFNVVDLLDDTLKYQKDIAGIYQHLSYDYQKVPDQEKYQPPVKEKKQSQIEKGQLAIETNSEKRFMNAKVTNPKVVPLLYAKYKTDLFVFINQLDIKASGSPDPTQFLNTTPNRKISVHYTVYSYDAREINSGLAEEEFDPSLNNPRKIIDKHFSKVAETIAQRVNRQLSIAAKAK